MHSKQIAINSLCAQLNLSCTSILMRLTSDVLLRKPYACKCKMAEILEANDSSHQLLSTTDRMEILKHARACEASTDKCSQSTELHQIKKAASQFLTCRNQTFQLLKQKINR